MQENECRGQHRELVFVNRGGHVFLVSLLNMEAYALLIDPIKTHGPTHTHQPTCDGTPATPPEAARRTASWCAIAAAAPADDSTSVKEAGAVVSGVVSSPAMTTSLWCRFMLWNRDQRAAEEIYRDRTHTQIHPQTFDIPRCQRRGELYQQALSRDVHRPRRPTLLRLLLPLGDNGRVGVGGGGGRNGGGLGGHGVGEPRNGGAVYTPVRCWF